MNFNVVPFNKIIQHSCPHAPWWPSNRLCTSFCQSCSWLRRGVEHGWAVVRLLLVCVCQHQRRGYHHPEQRSSISTLFIWESDMIYSVYSLIKSVESWDWAVSMSSLHSKGVTLSGLWPSSASASLSHPPCCCTSLHPLAGLSLSPLEMPERPGQDQSETVTGQTSQSEASCVVCQRVPAPHQLLLCSIPLLGSPL